MIFRPYLDPHPHRRRNALSGEWVLVSPHRTQRPWQGRQEAPAAEDRPAYDARCYLCPGNTRANGEQNPAYESTFVFDNDFAALVPDTPPPPEQVEDKLFQSRPARGVCKVLCFSPRHDLTLARMSAGEIRQVVDAWATASAELGQKWRWVQVFENKGDLMGCSNPHPHGQIWASEDVPAPIQVEDAHQSHYWDQHRTPLLVEYAQQELSCEERVVVQNEHWVAVVPYWAVWPFELLLLPKAHVARLPDLSGPQRDGLAEILRRLLIRYDNLFETSFPYSMGWHGAPYGDGRLDHWQLHAHFYPPLLRSATVKKFMVGYEMLSEPQRDLTPEAAAAQLRNLSETHFRSSAQGATH